MPNKPRKGINRVEIDCVFRGHGRSRTFTCLRNLEATNMLMHKIDRLGIANKKGKLVFEFRW